MKSSIIKIEGKDGKKADQMHEYVKKILIDEEINFKEMTLGTKENKLEITYSGCLLLEALRLIILEEFKSTAMLQGKLKIGYPRALKLIKLLEKAGVIEKNKNISQGRSLKGWYATEEARINFEIK